MVSILLWFILVFQNLKRLLFSSHIFVGIYYYKIWVSNSLDLR